MINNEDKNIYDMLNDIQIDLSEFEREEFNDIEKRKIKKRFRKSIGKKNLNTNYKKYASVVSIFILSVAIISVTPLGAYASKIISDLVFDIKSALNLEVDDGNYIKVINQSITKEDLTLRLNEAVLNNNELIVSMTIKSEDRIPKDMRIEGGLNQKLYINGEFVDEVNMITGRNASRKSIDEVLFFDLDTDKYSGVVDIKIELDSLSVYRYVNDKYEKEKTVEGPFVFEFDFDTTKINKNIKNIELNKEIDFGNNQKVMLEKFVYTPLTQKIYYTQNEEAFNNNIDLILKGIDDLGNEVEFETDFESDGSGTLVTNLSAKQVNKSAKYLNLTAYKKIVETENNSAKIILKEIENNIKIDLTVDSK